MGRAVRYNQREDSYAASQNICHRSDLRDWHVISDSAARLLYYIRVVQGLEQDQQETDGSTFEEHQLGECLLELPAGLRQGARTDVT